MIIWQKNNINENTEIIVFDNEIHQLWVNACFLFDDYPSPFSTHHHKNRMPELHVHVYLVICIAIS